MRQAKSTTHKIMYTPSSLFQENTIDQKREKYEIKENKAQESLMQKETKVAV